MEESFGKLYCLPDIKNNGEWTNHLIKRISKLRCSFEEETEILLKRIEKIELIFIKYKLSS